MRRTPFLLLGLMALLLAACAAPAPVPAAPVASQPAPVAVVTVPDVVVDDAPTPATPASPAGDVRDCAGSFNHVWRATLASMEAAGYAVPSELTTSATEGELQVGDATVSAEQVDENLTRVTVRVGALATDEERRVADQIHAGIASRVSAP